LIIEELPPLDNNITQIASRADVAWPGHSTREQLARKIGCSKYTIRNWERQGLPVIRRGNLRLDNDELTFKWLTGELPATAPRGPGRPRKTA
jgi:transcriptional regulator with XRE-family HTH domain